MSYKLLNLITFTLAVVTAHAPCHLTHHWGFWNTWIPVVYSHCQFHGATKNSVEVHYL